MSKGKRERIQIVLTACKGHWRTEGVPESRIGEMSEELERHLLGSVSDGNTVEDVVGVNVAAFAGKWAAYNQPRKPVAHEILEMLAATSAFMFFIVLAAHLWWGSSSLSVSWDDVGFSAILIYGLSQFFAQLRRPSGVPEDSEKSVWDIYPAWLRVGLITFAILAVTYEHFLQSTEEVVFVWPWPATVALLAASPVLLGLKSFIRDDGTGHRHDSWEDKDDYLYDELDVSDEIDLVVKDGVFHWKTDTRIPAAQAREMGEELERHLWDAVKDGKPVKSVVGPDVEAFAESWADADRPTANVKDRILEIVFAVMAFLTLAAVIGHLLEWSLYVPVLWFLVLLFIGLGSSLIHKTIETRRRPQTSSLQRNWLSSAAVMLLIFGLAGGIAFVMFELMKETPLESLRWPWYVTVTSAAGAIVTLVLWVKE